MEGNSTGQDAKVQAGASNLERGKEQSSLSRIKSKVSWKALLNRGVATIYARTQVRT